MTTTKKTQRNLPWTILVLLGVFFLVVQSLKGFQGSQSRPRSLSIIDIPYKHPSEQYNQTTATNETNYYATPDIPRHGDVFAPGSLSISRLNAYKKCFVDPTKYAKHIRDRRICEISTKYNLTYFMIAKAGSSTCRHVMKKFFEATETKCQNEQLNSLGLGTRNDSMFHFTFVREPSSRFLSSYQEAIKKSFYNNHEIAIPQQYVDSFLTPIKRFKYGELFNTALGQRIFQQTTENFIMTYDGNIPFEGHLRLQLPRLYNPQSKRTFPLEGIYDTKTMEQDFHQIAKMVSTKQSPEVIHAYDKGSKRIDMVSLSFDVRRKICELTAIDYCCLNYELPLECKGVVQCQWIHKPEISEELLIEPITPSPTFHNQ